MLAVLALGGKGNPRSLRAADWDGLFRLLACGPDRQWRSSRSGVGSRGSQRQRSGDACWVGLRDGWVYPPVFLLVAAPLAALLYLLALLIWQLLSVVAVAVALNAILKDRLAVLICVASPLTPMVLAHGQNAFLTAGLLGLGLVSLKQARAAGAGAFGGLVYKLQLALQLAPLLLFTRNW